jgi:hypothetical protein
MFLATCVHARTPPQTDPDPRSFDPCSTRNLGLSSFIAASVMLQRCVLAMFVVLVPEFLCQPCKVWFRTFCLSLLPPVQCPVVRMCSLLEIESKLNMVPSVKPLYCCTACYVAGSWTLSIFLGVWQSELIITTSSSEGRLVLFR